MKHFFVAPDGNDLNDGMINAPFATLERARDAIRVMKQTMGLPSGGISIHLREGVYRLANSFQLNEQDSGTENSPIVYKAYQDENVRLMGGLDLTESVFEPVIDEAVRNRIPQEARSKVLQYDLKNQGITEYGDIRHSGFGSSSVDSMPELFFNGDAMTLARWPNEGYVKTGEIKDTGTIPRNYALDIPTTSQDYVPPEQRDNPYRGFIFGYQEERPNRWVNVRDVWLFGYWYHDWADGFLQVESIDTEAKCIKTLQPSWYGVRSGQRYYAFNILEELDVPGEWYLDREFGILYFYPPSPMERSTIQLSIMKEPFIFMNNASYVTVQGLILEVSRGDGVKILGGSCNRILNCVIRKLGQKGVVVGNFNSEDPIIGGTGHQIVGCEIYDTGSGGITLSGGDRRNLTPGGHIVENNHIFRYSRIKKTYSEAIQIYGVGNKASHNRIHEAPHAAIMYWGNDHIIEYNEIFNVVLETDDAGAIYAGRDWTYRGNVIRYNFIHHVSGIEGSVGAFGVYMDDAVSSTEIYGNVFYKVWRAFHMGGGRDHLIANNLILEGNESVSFDDRAQLDWFKAHMHPEQGTLFVNLREVPYQSEVWKQKYPRLFNILNDDPGVPKGNSIVQNIIYKTKPMELADMVIKHGKVEDNLQLNDDADLGFEDVSQLNFALRQDSVVFQLIPDFKPIPFEKIGLLKEFQ